MSTTVNAEVAGTGDFNISTVTVNTGISGVGGAGAPDTAVNVNVPFSGAVTDSLVWTGPGKLVQVVVETGAIGSIVIKDEFFAGIGATIASLTTTAAPETFLINSGAGTDFYAGMTITITGANSGYLLVQES